MSGPHVSTEWTVIKPDGEYSGIWTSGRDAVESYRVEGDPHRGYPPPPEGSYVASRTVTYGEWVKS